MSFEPILWAREQIIESISRKSLLLTISTYANKDGIAWPPQTMLARNTGCGISTVQREMKRLESDGFITRRLKGRRSNGAPIIEIKLCMQIGRSDPNLKSKVNTSHDEPKSKVVPGEDTSTNSSAHLVVSGAVPSEQADNKLPVKLPRKTPPAPRWGREERPHNLQSSRDETNHFKRFRNAWPNDKTIRWQHAERLFSRLSTQDQVDAACAVSRYIGECERIHRKLMFPGTWIRERMWENFRSSTRTNQVYSESTPRKVWIREDTPEWLAWKAYFLSLRKPMRTPQSCKGQLGLGWFFDALTPPKINPRSEA